MLSDARCVAFREGADDGDIGIEPAWPEWEKRKAWIERRAKELATQGHESD